MARPREEPRPPLRQTRTRRMAVMVDPVITWIDVQHEEGTDVYGTALDSAEKHISSIADANVVAIMPADTVVEYKRGWISKRELTGLDGTAFELQPQRGSRWRPDEPHPFQGVLLGVADRDCTLCHLADRNPIHDLSKIR